MTGKTFLDKAYGVSSPDEVVELYDDWAGSYDGELTGQGYATPGRIAATLAAHLPDRDAPILDFGCGTGLSGQALAAEGFTRVDGADVSVEMLAEANEKGVYRRLLHLAPDAPLPVRPGDYAAIAAAGVIGAGAAPLSSFDRVMAALGPGGLFAVSFNDHTLEDPAYEGRIDAAVKAGEARLVLREYGDHVPGIDLKAVVYLLEKT